MDQKIDSGNDTMNFKDAMVYMKIGKTALLKLLKENKIRAYSPTKKILFYKTELEEDVKKLNYKNQSI